MDLTEEQRTIVMEWINKHLKKRTYTNYKIQIDDIYKCMCHDIPNNPISANNFVYLLHDLDYANSSYCDFTICHVSDHVLDYTREEKIKWEIENRE